MASERDEEREAQAAERTAQRGALLLKLRAEGRLDLAARLAKCGQPLTLRCQDCTRPRHVLTRCDLKWCPACQRALAARTAGRYARIAAHCKWPLFVTFNCIHTRDDGTELLRTVRRAHTQMRRLRWWKARVPGGVIAYEISRLTVGERKKRRLGADKGWHPHGHALIDCKLLAVDESAPRVGAPRDEWARKAKAACDEVAEQWSLCLGRRGSVAVRRVWLDPEGTINGAMHEVLKYSVKGAELAEQEAEVGPVIDELDRCRLVVPFGSFHGHPDAKRRRLAPSACDCGCCKWLPEEVIERSYFKHLR